MYLYGYYKLNRKQDYTYSARFKFWLEMLFEKCVRIFEWQGLPETIPQHEIEKELVLHGFCGVVKSDINNKFYAIENGGLTGVTEYKDIFTRFVFGNQGKAFRGGKNNYKIGKDCVIVKNCALYNPMIDLIENYAHLLAHAEVTLALGLVNNRAPKIFTADDDKTVANINAFYNNIYEGNPKGILDPSLLGIKGEDITQGTANDVSKILEVRNDLLRSFYNDIGVKCANNKKERQVVSEVESDEQMLLFNIDDMLASREKACEEMKKVLGLNVSVKKSRAFNDMERSNVNDNCGTNNE